MTSRLRLEHARRVSLVLVVVVFGAAAALGLDAQQRDAAAETALATALSQSASDDLETRQSAFFALLAQSELGKYNGDSRQIPAHVSSLLRQFPQRQQDIRDGLIALVIRENVERKAPSHTESFGDYFGDLLIAVSALRDKRAIGPLIEALPTGNLATRAVAAFGSDALDAVLNIPGNDVLMQMAKTRTLAQMVAPNNRQVLDPGSLSRVKAALIVASSHESRFIRLAAIEGLVEIPGADVTAVLSRIAAGDPYVQLGPVPIYPVRNAAQAALAKRDKG